MKQKTSPIFSAIAVLLMSFAIFATPAFAKDYELTSTDIVANVNSDASMNVTQTRTFEFDGTFTLMMIPLGTDTKFSINSVSLNIDGNDVALGPVAFQTSWRKSGAAGKACYSIDEEQGTVYVFTTSSASVQTVKLDYVYPEALKVHDDVAELYWKFVSDGWEKSSKNVVCTVNLPVPAGTTPSSTDIRAWAHGNLTGKVENNSNGIVKMAVDKVRSGEYAESRIIFPTSWMTSSVKSTSAYVSGNATDSILAEEAKYAEGANAKRSQSLVFVGVCVALPIIFLIITIILFLKFGREYKPRFTDEYWRDVPDPEFHPAVIARNERWGKKSSADISTTIMHLHVNGYISVEEAKRDKMGVFKKKQVDDFIISKTPNMDAPKDKIDAQTMKFLFEDVQSSVPDSGDGVRKLYISDISAMLESNKKKIRQAYDNWQSVLDGQEFKADLFETTGASIASAYKIIACVLVVLGCTVFFGGVTIFTDDILIYALGSVIVMFVIAVVVAVFAKVMNRRTHHANELHAKTMALKKWLCEFTTLNERPALDTKVWGEFMVYATILGVADKAFEQMKITEPDYFADDYIGSSTYLPWWFWTSHGTYAGLGRNGGGFDALDAAFADFSSEFDSGASGNWSGAGGFGGGFSIGGGGGFGGGGFGGAR